MNVYELDDNQSQFLLRFVVVEVEYLMDTEWVTWTVMLRVLWMPVNVEVYI